jgi:Protein of unknown function (DUF3443)
VRNLFALLLAPLILLAACGGGGGSSNSGGGGGGGGGGGDGGTQTIATPGPPNVEPMVVDAGPAGLPAPSVNTAFVSVQVCVPATATCQTIDHVEVDSGSVGLRLLAPVVTVALPLIPDGANTLAECLQFADGTESYGSLATADMVMPVSGEKASSVVVQLIGAASAGTPPGACTGTPNNTVATFGANGILGVGPFINDCNTSGNCGPGQQAANYYSCTTPPPTPPNTCGTFTASLAQQVHNPVILLPKDNNGVILELPAVASTGATNVKGSLVFGIGTETNNALGNALQLLADANGYLKATLGSGTYPNSYLDSGSNANFVNTSIATCTDNTFLCPPSATNESAVLIDSNGTTATADFQIANADTLFNGAPTATAFNNLGAAAFDMTTLDMGLPFFFGHNVYTTIEDPNLGSNPSFALAIN